MTLSEYKELIELARPRDDGDWGDPRQVYLENLAMTELGLYLSPTQWQQLEDWATHATADELLNRALELFTSAWEESR